jgi:hypothetical protein
MVMPHRVIYSVKTSALMVLVMPSTFWRSPLNQKIASFTRDQTKSEVDRPVQDYAV